MAESNVLGGAIVAAGFAVKGKGNCYFKFKKFSSKKVGERQLLKVPGDGDLRRPAAKAAAKAAAEATAKAAASPCAAPAAQHFSFCLQQEDSAARLGGG